MISNILWMATFVFQLSNGADSAAWSNVMRSLDIYGETCGQIVDNEGRVTELGHYERGINSYLEGIRRSNLMDMHSEHLSLQQIKDKARMYKMDRGNVLSFKKLSELLIDQITQMQSGTSEYPKAELRSCDLILRIMYDEAIEYLREKYGLVGDDFDKAFVEKTRVEQRKVKTKMKTIAQLKRMSSRADAAKKLEDKLPAEQDKLKELTVYLHCMREIKQTIVEQNLLPEDDNCSICCDEWGDLKKVECTPCGHYFHKDCIGRWVQDVKPECPMCKGPIN